MPSRATNRLPTSDPLCWLMPLTHKPAVDLMALGTHGPNIIERMSSQRHWWLHLYRYRATLRLDGRTFTLRPGMASLVRPGVNIEYVFGERASHLCAHFRLPETGPDDNRGTGLMRVSAVQDLGDAFPALYAAMEEAAICFADTPLRAEVRLWDVLWQLAQPPGQGTPPLHAFPAAFQQARQIIEQRLGEPLSVQALAAEVDVSHNHLTRLFRRATGGTVVGYIQARRVERARHLLAHTTLPIKAVAAQVGVEDTRQFYKLVRGRLGMSPSQVRQQGQDVP